MRYPQPGSNVNQPRELCVFDGEKFYFCKESLRKNKLVSNLQRFALPLRYMATSIIIETRLGFSLYLKFMNIHFSGYIRWFPIMSQRQRQTYSHHFPPRFLITY